MKTKKKNSVRYTEYSDCTTYAGEEHEIEDMKKWWIAQSPRDQLLFVLDINSGLQISVAGRGIQDKIGTHRLRKSFGYHTYKSGTDNTLLPQIFNMYTLVKNVA